MQSKNPFSFCTSLRLFFFKTRSSPHMRGIPVGTGVVVGLVGIIPAHAGHTSRATQSTFRTWDRPRTCGVYCFYGFPLFLVSGSSPHMRGIRKLQGSCIIPVGIIPAHAGHTCCRRRRRRSIWDHPRTCRAYSAEQMALFCNQGSSPHMRGIHAQIEAMAQVIGIIPAHAGHTSSRGRTDSRSWDHPRTCGAY